MATGNYTQTSFLGGEISQWSQGAFDKPYYKISLSKAFNLWPSDEGACPRRPGFRFLGTTKKGSAGRLIAFDFSQASPYNVEITDSCFRMWNNNNLVTTNDSMLCTVSSDTTAVFTLSRTVAWATGDTVTFGYQSAQASYVGNILLNKQFIITMLTNTTFTVADALTGHVIGVSDNVAGLTPVVNHVLEISTVYTVAGFDWHTLRMVQGYNEAVFLHVGVAPQVLNVVSPPTNGAYATFSFSPAQFTDGPYLDPPVGAIATASSTSAFFQLVVSYPAWSNQIAYSVGDNVNFFGTDYVSLVDNNLNTPTIPSQAWQGLQPGSMVNSGIGFQQTDVGRMIRLFYQPPVWSSTDVYATGANVTFNGSYFTSLVDTNTGNQPDISTTQWVINPALGYWTWGNITAVSDPKTISVQLQSTTLTDLTPMVVWSIGAWSNTTGWPTCGCYQEGRFWYSGAIANRVDSSMSNDPFAMAPTAQDGTVNDNSGISYIFNATEQNIIFWGIPDHQGILWGTQEGEFLMSSGTNGTPMTPSNIQAHRETKYGSSNIQPVRTGLTICFVKRYARRIWEYLADVFSGRFFGNDLTQNARHLGARVIEEIDYQEELVPTVWGRCADGTLIGATYRRNSLFSNQPAEFTGWHQHALGSGRLIESISVGPSVEGTLDALSVVSNDPTTNIRFVEQMTTLLDETASITQSWYLDTAVTPGIAAANINSIFGLGNVTAGAVFNTSMSAPNAGTVQMNGVRPIVATGTVLAVKSIWLGAVAGTGPYTIQVQNMNVSGQQPALTATYNSSSFSLSAYSNFSWSLDPTGRYIAIMVTDSSVAVKFVVFDTVALTFGTLLAYTNGQSGGMSGSQIAWIDSTHFVVSNLTNAGGTGVGAVGVELFSVSGTTITHVSFTGIWGPTSNPPTSGGSAANYRYLLGCDMQFLPNTSGTGLLALTYATTDGGAHKTMSVIPIHVSSGAIVQGSQYSFGVAIKTSLIGSGPTYNVVSTSSSGEVTFCFSGVLGYILFSVVLGPLGCVFTRQPVFFTYPGGIVANTQAVPTYIEENNTLILTWNDGGIAFNITDFYLDATSFVQLVADVPVTNVNYFGNVGTTRLDSLRLLLIAPGAFNNGLNICIVADPPNEASFITFYGLEPFNGRKVSVFAAGIDCGDYVVEGGQVDVPLGIADPITGWVFNAANFATLQSIQDVFADVSVPVLVNGTVYNIPCVIGFNYESQGQLCRPQTAPDTGSHGTSGFGKKRRSSKYAIQLVNAIGVKVGVNMQKTNLVPVNKIDAGGVTLNYLTTFTGVMRESLDDSFSYDSMLAWKIDRPYPATVTAFGAFIDTQDI